MTKKIPLVISDTMKTSPELNDLRGVGTINQSDTSIRQLHERISEMETSGGHLNLSSTLLSLNDSFETLQHLSDRTYSHL